MYFDTHAHYDSGAFNADWKELLASMPQKGVELIVNPGCDLESSRTAVALAEEFPHVYAAVGVHPSDCGEWGEGTLLELRQLASRPKVRAIGEIGLTGELRAVSNPGQRINEAYRLGFHTCIMPIQDVDEDLLQKMNIVRAKTVGDAIRAVL